MPNHVRPNVSPTDDLAEQFRRINQRLASLERASGGGGGNHASDLFVVDSTGDATIEINADTDNVNEADTATLRLTQDDRLVTAEFGINEANQAYLDTNYADGGPYMKWVNRGDAGFVPASGVTANSVQVWRCGSIGWVSFDLNWTFPATNPTGDIGNTLLGTIGAAYRGDAPNGQTMSTGNIGPMVGCTFNPTSGTLYINSMMPNQSAGASNRLVAAGMVMWTTSVPA